MPQRAEVDQQDLNVRAGRGLVQITLEAEQRRSALRRSLATRLLQALSHEVDHSGRIQAGLGCQTTLREELVCEGVASAFDLEVQPTIHLPWTDALTVQEERVMWRRARPLLNRTGLYDRWFFGGTAVPYRTGFQIGYHIVRDYLDRHPEPQRRRSSTKRRR